MSHLYRPASRTLLRFSHWHRWGTTLLGLLFLSPGLAAASPSHCEAQARRSHLSLPVTGLASWEPVDERTLLVWAPSATRAHLLRLDRPVTALSWAAVVTLIDGDHDGAITACGRDGILISGGRGRRAFISSIQYLSEKRTVELDRNGWSALPLQARLAPLRHAKRPG